MEKKPKTPQAELWTAPTCHWEETGGHLRTSLGLLPLSESQVLLASNEDSDATRAATGGGVTERCHLSPGRWYCPSQGSVETASLELKPDRDVAQPDQAEMVQRQIQMELKQRSSCSAISVFLCSLLKNFKVFWLIEIIHPSIHFLFLQINFNFRSKGYRRTFKCVVWRISRSCSKKI